MAEPLKFAALFPKHLDLNGDHGNLLVLQKRLNWRGVSAQIVPVTDSAKLERFDFVLLGHGSKDAWSEVLRIDPELMVNVANFARDGKPVLAISSGYEHLVKELEGIKVEPGEHTSEFRQTDDVVGYVNSDSGLPEIRTWLQTVMTLFHGPVLAKNNGLADKIIANAGWCDVSISSRELRQVNDLAAASCKQAFED